MKKKIYTILDNCYTLYTCGGKSILKFSKKNKEEYHHLVRLASSSGLPSLSASQIGSDLNMFVILAQRKLLDGKWKGYKADINDYEVYCNPRIQRYSVEELDSF